MKALLRRWALGALLPLALLAIWLAAARGSAVVPSPAEVLAVLLHPCRRPTELDASSLAAGTLVSLLRVAAGLAAAVLTAVPLGLAAGRSTWLRELLRPALALAMVVSPVAWMPLAVLALGFSGPATLLAGDEAWRYPLLDQLRWAMILVIWLGAAFPIFVNTMAGAQGVRRAHLDAARMLGATPAQQLTRVVLPSAYPAIMTGLRLGGGMAWRVIIAAELFPGTRGGLGYMIATAHRQASYAYAFAAIVVVAGIGMALDALLSAAARRAGHWQAEQV